MPVLGVPALAGIGAGGTAAVGTGAVVTTGAAVGTGATISTTTAVVGGAALAGTLMLSGSTPQNSHAAAAAAPATPALTPQQLADRLKKVKEAAKALADAAAASCATGNCCHRVVTVSRRMSPESAKHIEDAQAMGYPSILTIDRIGARGRGDRSVYGIPTVANYQRDEYPPKVFAENAGSASVRYVPSSDNMSAGSQIRWGIDGAPNGCRVTLVTGP